MVVGPATCSRGGKDFVLQHVDIGLGGIARRDPLRRIDFRDQVALVDLRAFIDGEADHAAGDLRGHNHVIAGDDSG